MTPLLSMRYLVLTFAFIAACALFALISLFDLRRQSDGVAVSKQQQTPDENSLAPLIDAEFQAKVAALKRCILSADKSTFWSKLVPRTNACVQKHSKYNASSSLKLHMGRYIQLFFNLFSSLQRADSARLKSSCRMPLTSMLTTVLG